MDVGFYSKDEQFSFSPSPYAYLENYSTGSLSDITHQGVLFEDLAPLPEPPSELFEWEGTDTLKEMRLNLNIEEECNEILNAKPTPGATNVVHTLLDWEESKMPTPEVNYSVSQLQNPILLTVNPKSVFCNSSNNRDLQNVFELPETIERPQKQPIRLEDIENEVACCNSENSVGKLKGNQPESSDILNTSFGSTELNNFDIAEYVFEEHKQTKTSISEPTKQIKTELIDPKIVTEDAKPTCNKRTVKAGVKKIDLKARRYIIEINKEEDDIDIETVSEEGCAPVLEAGNISDLLEQFEATEVKSKLQGEDNKYLKPMSVEAEKVDNHKLERSVKKEPKAHKRKRNETSGKPVKCEKENVKRAKPNEPEIKPPREQLVINGKNHLKSVQKPTESSKPKVTPSTPSNKHIINSLPRELIDRIKESGKRKPITVIEPIPNVNNRFKKSKIRESNKIPAPVAICNVVQLDHNYCNNKVTSRGQCDAVNTVVLNKKDSGFVSSEDDDKNVISRQPTVKNADGTLMVSLLKTNTIHQVKPSSVANNRKKLNLEEYKKRRNGILTSRNNSVNCSPNTSTCSSPVPEDDHQKMLRHQEKLRRMAQELLKTAPKSDTKYGGGLKPLPINPAGSESKPPVVRGDLKVSAQNYIRMKVAPPKIEPPKLPPNLERKIYVSCGVNTDFRISKNHDPLAPVEKLQEIKPLLEKAKISGNSLISSVIENIPKVIDRNEKPLPTKPLSEAVEHGECTHFVYLEKDRVKCETMTVETQTSISLIEQSKRGRVRRRLSTSSSGSVLSYNSSSRRSEKSSRSSSSSRCSASPHRGSYSSRSSEYSYSSGCSSRLSYSRSSRSRSPIYHRKTNNSVDRDHLNAVEERRIIYVGKISPGTTKDDLRRKFHRFGPINKISLHFRDIGENYGFVTFKYKEDAHKAYERGNDDPSYPPYKISFGGRREFCKSAYSDLDNVRDESHYHSKSAAAGSYDKLLQEALEKLKKRKV